MLGEVKALRRLQGFRGKAHGDMEALAEAIVALSHAPRTVVEAEVNPVLVLPEGQGVRAVDAVVTIRKAADGGGDG